MLHFFLLFAAIAVLSAGEYFGLIPKYHQDYGPLSLIFPSLYGPREHYEQDGPHSPEFFGPHEQEEPYRRHGSQSFIFPELEIVLESRRIIVPIGSILIPEWVKRPYPPRRTLETNLPLNPTVYEIITPVENEDYPIKIVSEETETHPTTPLPDDERTTTTAEKEKTKEETTTAAKEDTTMASTSAQPHGTEEGEFTPIFEGTTIAPVW
ncbi:unnamed protein product [Cylicocyclus nassatus]|uniref:Uncharacterized protein n=1 Tax=Cylicocyclus nassatus TaxID=53992 RepID=A0AA36HDG7_CYLNA|nr:unnamed protein product [Cylicocyclus nassatus]